MTMAAENYIAKLNEYAQGNRLELSYEDVSSVGPDHIKRFTMRAVLNNKKYLEGEGNNKKEAKQNAAKNALETLLEQQTHCTDEAADTSDASVHQTSILSKNFVCWLNEYGNKNKVIFKAVETTTLGPNKASYCCKYLLGDEEYPPGYGNSKKEAKEEAAKHVHQKISGGETTQTRDSGYISSLSEVQESKPDASGTPDPSKRLSLTGEGVNFIGLLNEHCMKTKSTAKFVLVERRGQAHNPTFLYKVVIDKVEYPVAEGRSAKEAKQKAAQLALEAIDEPSDPKIKNQSPSVKNKKIKIAANFQADNDKSKEGLMPTFSGDMPQSGQSEIKASGQSLSPQFDSIKYLGEGTYGKVYKAREILVDEVYAVKIVRWKTNILREVKALSILQHQNIVRYYSCWTEETANQMDGSADSGPASQSAAGKLFFIKMELCDTQTLGAWIKDRNSQSTEEWRKDSKRREDSLKFVHQIANGVEHIHSMKFIHRDLKPANILFGLRGEVKIGDFGLVTSDNDAENPIERTACTGTPCYMAPEQRYSHSYDRKVDIFALGLIYFELLWKLSDKARKETFCNVREQKLPDGFSVSFFQECQVIKSMLCSKPEDRPEAAKLKKDLEEWMRNVPDDSQTL